MSMDEVYDRFVEHSPFSVMTRGILEYCFSHSSLDQLFAETAQVQYSRKLLFSDLVSLLTKVVLRVRPSLRNAYQRSSPLPATLKSVYEKLNAIETDLSEALVAQIATRAQTLLDSWPNSRRPEPVAGLRLRILDGNHLSGTDHRLKPLREEGAAALPGMCIALREDATGLISRLLCREDAYTGERTLVKEMLAWVKADDLIVADRNFLGFDFLKGIVDRKAYFVLRHNRSTHLREKTSLRRIGSTATGEVYEQRVGIGSGPHQRTLRCVVVRLYEPTQEGETEIRLLSNVPSKRADALVLAGVYLRRWRIEHSFQVLTDHLRCEINTLGYPPAALFGFSLAVCAYNAVMVMQASLAAIHGSDKVERELSTSAIAAEINQDFSGLLIALPEEYWSRFGRLEGKEMSVWLAEVAKTVCWSKYQKSRQGPRSRASKEAESKPEVGFKPSKQKPKKRKGSWKRAHISTARLLE